MKIHGKLLDNVGEVPYAHFGKWGQTVVSMNTSLREALLGIRGLSTPIF